MCRQYQFVSFIDAFGVGLLEIAAKEEVVGMHQFMVVHINHNHLLS
jgi:hypothetical protein